MMEIEFLRKTRYLDVRVVATGYFSKRIEVLGIYSQDKGDLRRRRRLENAVATLPVLQEDFYDAVDWAEPDLLVELAF